jgi:chemotaxis methyl-accepting protein methylase
MSLPAEVRSEFLDLVDQRFGIRGSEYGISRIDEAVTRVLETTTCQTYLQLLHALATGAPREWLELLVEGLTVGETYFFRDPAQVSALREVILPTILQRRAADRRMRVWSAGCSTGEEPYTFAMLLRELPGLADWQVHLFGTDVNRESLTAAREGSYAPWSFRATPNAQRERFFEPDGHRWRVIDAVRRMVRFGWMNLAADPLVPPASDFDLIACRNVTIYFDDAATQRLYRALVQALAPGGWLVLGPSDPLPSDRDLLERVETGQAVLWRRRNAAKPAAPAARVPERVFRQTPIAKEHRNVVDARAELEAGLLALEAGSAQTALDWLRRATFRDPQSPLGQFALARAYLGVGDLARAQAALLHARRLLEPFEGRASVPASDDMSVESLRQAVQAALEEAA